jgi:hypothetical protein
MLRDYHVLVLLSIVLGKYFGDIFGGFLNIFLIGYFMKNGPGPKNP